MNIFWLDSDPGEAAEYYCDKHIVKINVEINQLLSTALRDNGYEWDFLYQRTHGNHPLSEWVGESESNFFETVRHAHSLGREYSHRYGGEHKSHRTVSKQMAGMEVDLPQVGSTPKPQAMPDRFKVDGEVVEAYREYYREGKDWDMSWTNRDVPDWY